MLVTVANWPSFHPRGSIRTPGFTWISGERGEGRAVKGTACKNATL